MSETPLTPEPLLIDDREFARLLGIGRSTFHRLRSAGKIGPQTIRLGRSCRFNRCECLEWAAAGCPDRATWQAMRATRRLRA
jgi:excisionase family DNA binding protein